MRFLRNLSLSGRAALAVLGLSLLVFLGELRGALRLDPLPEAAVVGDFPGIPEVVLPAPSVPSAVLLAVSRDPFRPERQRPAGRYRMPGENVVYASPAYGNPGPGRGDRLGSVELQGIVTLPQGGGLAALWIPGRSAQLVRVGQTFEGYRLTRVGAGTAVLVGSDTTITLRLGDHDPDPDVNLSPGLSRR